MNTALLAQEPKSKIELSAFADAWAIEKDDIDERLSGNDPDSFQTLFGNVSKDIQAKTGAERWAQLAALSLTPGGIQVALGFGAIGAGVDLVNNFKFIAKADETERVLALRTLPIDTVNWDLAERLAEHIRSWLLPRFNTRIEGLRAVLKASDGHQVVVDRLSLYDQGIVEVKQALTVLEMRTRVLKATWKERYKSYAAQSSEAKKIYEDAKRGVELSAAALLYDRTAAAQKLDEIENSYKRLGCIYSGFLTGCENLACEGTGLCPQHLCFEAGCNKQVINKKRYCKEHGEQLVHISAHLPKLLAQNPSLMKKPLKEPLTPSEKAKKNARIQNQIALIGICAFVFFMLLILAANVGK